MTIYLPRRSVRTGQLEMQIDVSAQGPKRSVPPHINRSFRQSLKSKLVTESKFI